MILNFDYIRLFLALLVMLEHYGFRLFGSIPYLSWFNGDEAVFCFFVISGYFITLSYLRSKNLEDYFLKRLKRIYPPILMLGCFMIVFGLLNNLEANFFRSVLNFLTFEELSRPVGASPFVIFANPPFWSLVIEFQFYLILPLILFFREKKHFSLILLAMAAVAILVKILMEGAALNKPLDRGFTRQSLLIYLHFFALGIGCAVFWQKKISCYISEKKSSFGDLSYGVYIYHWVVMDIARSCGLGYDRRDIIIMVFITLILAFLSWHFVEKRILSTKNGKI